ncbi:MAG: AAA family ATPase [Actinomycetota bacterium]|nr:AAA family ATPase [Actinomycetota bacterium]
MRVCASCGHESPDGFRFCGRCGADLASAPKERRKLATLLFCDMSGSTALGERVDAESVREMMVSYFDEMRRALERHGGTVEKFIGDAVVAVFGVPEAHDDDALRAVRAAWEMRERLGGLNAELERRYGTRIALRIGLNTGEVVAGDVSSRQTIVTGDAVNIAARLEQAAPPGETLLGETTRQFVRDAVAVERHDQLAVKGKADPVLAWRLVDVLPDVPAFSRPILTPFVGRRPELDLVRAALERVATERTCEICTVVGPPGIGKSRLAREFLADAGPGARAVVGRCLPYGDGITFWPLAEIVRQVAGEQPRQPLLELLAADEYAELAVDRITAAVGVADGAPQAGHVFWAFRRFFEALARERPLVAVVDDIHWAEPTLLDLLEYLATLATDAPTLFLCLARPDVFDARPSWAVPRAGASIVRLEPLAASDITMLVEGLGGEAAGERERIVDAASGNPLFAEQLVAFRAEKAGGTDQGIPPTIDVLLATRIDRLPTDERTVLEYAAVEGRSFHRGAVSALLPDEVRSALDAVLVALVRKEFVRADESLFRADDGFRFVHVLVRDAAYRSLPKHVRADLHERYAAWLEQAAADRLSAFEEILGYHLEQAYRLRTELGPVAEPARRVGERAAEYLVHAGRRAVARRDHPAAQSLLTRAADLLEPDDERRLGALLGLVDVALDGGDSRTVDELLAEVIARAERAGFEALATEARLRRALADAHAGGRDEREAFAELSRQARAAVGVFERVGDERRLAQALATLGRALFWQKSVREAEKLYEAAVEHARRAGDRHRETETLAWWTGAKMWGPTPVTEALAFCADVSRMPLGDPLLTVSALEKRGLLEAMRGRFAEGRLAVEEARQLAEDFGLSVRQGLVADYAGNLELLAGDFEAAERVLREGYDLLGSLGGEEAFRATLAGVLAEALYRQGRAAEALEVLDRIRYTEDEHAACRAKVVAALGDVSRAERLARHILAGLAPNEQLYVRANTLLDIATVLRFAGRPAEAAATASDAVRLFEEKGDVVSAARARAFVDDVRPLTP